MSDETGYPEHDKLRGVQDQSQTCGELLEWLPTVGLCLAEFVPDTSECTPDWDHEADGECSKWCRWSEQRLIPHGRRIAEVLARFFGIDEDRLDDEKRAMLAAIREHAA